MDKTYETILIEDLHHKMDLVIESLREFDAASCQRDEEIRREFMAEIRLVHSALRMVAQESKERDENLEKSLRGEIHSVQVTFQSSLQGVSHDLGQKIDQIHIRLDRHEKDIAQLKNTA